MELPRRLTPQVVEFRRQSLAMFLLAARAAIQAVDRRLRSVVMPPPLGAPASRYSGADDWRLLAESAAVDAVSLLVLEDSLESGGGDLTLQTDVASVIATRGKQLWVWVATDLAGPRSVADCKELAARLGAQQLVIADYESLVDRHGLTGLSELLARLRE